MLQCPTCGRRYASDVTICPADGTPVRADPTVAADIPVDSLLGRVLDDKYRLDARLGEGGMGMVYHATHLLIDRPVAVKILGARFVADKTAKERFRREARAAGRLRHPNAVAVTDFGETPDGLVYIVMELLEGRSLRDLLASEAPLAPAHALSLALQTAAAVAAAHEAGIIHRDLKPGNVFVVERPPAPPLVKVLDFGIAKLAAPDAAGDEGAVTLTETGVMIGTPRYMSPEQCDGAHLTPASDVYSLGVILYEMLTAETPFTGATPLSLALKHSGEKPRPPRELAPGVPPALEKLVLRALAKHPSERPVDAGAFWQELDSAADLLGLGRMFRAGEPPPEETARDGPGGRVGPDQLAAERAPTNRTTEDEGAAFETAEDELAPPTGRAAAPTFTGAPAATEESETPRFSSPATEPGDSSARRTAAAGARPRRLRIPLRHGRGQGLPGAPRLRQIPILIGAVIIILLAGALTVFVLWRSPQNRAGVAAADEEAVGRGLSGAGETPRRSAAAPPSREPRSATEFYERGSYHFSARDYDAAVRDYRRALELQPEFPEAHNRLGRVLMAKGLLAAAAEEFRRGIKQRAGSFAAAQYNLGYTLQLQGNRDEAVEAYTGAIRSRDGIYPDAFFQIGIIHLNARRFDEAVAALRRAIEQNGGRDPEAQAALGVALAGQGDYAGAEAAFRAAIEGRGGDYADAYYNLGLLYEKNDRTAEAIGAYETYLRQQPSGETRRRVENNLRALRRRAAREKGDQTR